MNIEMINLTKEVGLNPILILLVLAILPIFLKIENFIQSYDSIKSRKLKKSSKQWIVLKCQNWKYSV